MDRFVGLIGIVLILGFCHAISSDRKRINYRLVASGLGIQLALAVFILKTEVGGDVFGWLGAKIEALLGLSRVGAEFVFGSLAKSDAIKRIFGEDYRFLFFFEIIPTIIFVAVLVSIAYHIGLMQRVVGFMARGVYWLMGVSGSEALSNVASIFVGQVEAQIMIKPYLSRMTMSELLASMTGSMACIAGGVMAIYIAMGIEASYLLAASLMAAPGALVISKIVMPETQQSETRGRVRMAHTAKQHANVVDAISHGASDGLRVGLNVVAMLIGFLALIALVDAMLGGLGGLLAEFAGLDESVIGLDLSRLSLKAIFGWLFAPLAWCLGVPGHDIVQAGSLMGTKLAANEFIAYTDLSQIKTSLDPKTYAIVSFALCGFANLSSIAIQVGGIGQLAPERRADLARLGFKALVCGTLASYLSAALAGILL